MTNVDRPDMAIDKAHADLLHGLIRAQKPQSVLEFGFGSGKSSYAIYKALKANEQPFAYTIVENWAIWGDTCPYSLSPNRWITTESSFAEYVIHTLVRNGVKFVSEAERTFTLCCKDSFDFIFSDADHGGAQDWFERTYNLMLNPGGVLCYHDVRLYPNLWTIVEECRRLGLRHVVFDRNSEEGEWCDRGLLCIFKPSE